MIEHYFGQNLYTSSLSYYPSALNTNRSIELAVEKIPAL